MYIFVNTISYRESSNIKKDIQQYFKNARKID